MGRGEGRAFKESAIGTNFPVLGLFQLGIEKSRLHQQMASTGGNGLLSHYLCKYGG